jgi:hypothetical protein
MSRLNALLRRGGEARTDYLALIEQLTDANRSRPEPERERRILAARHVAFAALETSVPGPLAEPGVPPARAQQIPVADRDELTPELLRAAILDGGCLHVRGLVDPERSKRLANAIDRTFEAADAHDAGEVVDEQRAWYSPFKPSPGYKLGGGRKWNRDGGAIWAADSPRLMFDLTDNFERAGLRELIGGYLGERPALSMNKSVLRRVSPTTGGGADWHQDGAFLGGDIKSLNVWLTLSRCGDVAPGMDVVPARIDEIVPTGTEGANFNWSVSPAVVEEVSADAGVTRPVFEAGDALLFDHFFLHRTASSPEMTESRYAIETWFFAPSTYPDGQVPLVL